MILTRGDRIVEEEKGQLVERFRFHPADVEKMLTVIPYPSSDKAPISAWWERRDANFCLLVGRRGRDGRAVGDCWERHFNNTNHARALMKVAPEQLGAGRAVRVTWEPVAEDARPTTLLMRVVETDDAPPILEGDNYDAWSEGKLKTFVVTHKVKGVIKGMSPADIVAQIRAHVAAQKELVTA